VISIFGPTDPYFWKPLTAKIVIVYKKELECPGGYEHAKTCAFQKCLENITTHDVIDGVLLAISDYVDSNKIISLTRMKISETLSIKKTAKGYFLANDPTNHKCMIQRGWREVKKIMSTIKKQGTVQHLIQKNPESKLLVDFLIMHRIIQFRPVEVN
jgi:ADP-heptose:LPS heptosyltransferase